MATYQNAGVYGPAYSVLEVEDCEQGVYFVVNKCDENGNVPSQFGKVSTVLHPDQIQQLIAQLQLRLGQVPPVTEVPSQICPRCTQLMEDTL